MKYSFLSVFLCYFFLAIAQNPMVKQWDRRYGGNYGDGLYSFDRTLDGGFILGGVSRSRAGGDRTQENWDTTATANGDYWIVKLDSEGNKYWDRRFGGTDWDILYSVQQTLDGGYILGGSSNSDNSGDKTEHSWASEDYWIVKLNSAGDKQWDKRFGGFFTDRLCSVQQTFDGGYILGGYSASDSSGDKTQNSRGGTDYWVVKVDSNGNKQWDKRFGGDDNDILHCLTQTLDGGYILGGGSGSGVNGDKTIGNWGGNNDADYWVVKLNSGGVKEWDKRYGGTGPDELQVLKQTADNGYIFAGYSQSGVSGDKTQTRLDINPVHHDLWVIKVDSTGSKQWDTRFGTNDEDDGVYSVTQTYDGGYLFGGSSYAPVANGDKSENNLGLEQSWIIKTDSLGKKEWDKTLLTSGHDELGFAIQLPDACYAFANTSNGEIGGYKSQGSQGGQDYWIIKFCDSPNALTIIDAKDRMQCHMFPDPFSNEFSIVIRSIKSMNETTFLITNLLGQPVYGKQETNLSNSYIKTLDLSYLPNEIGRAHV